MNQTSPVAALSSEFNLLRYDTRGHGQSEVTSGEYAVALLGGDVLGLMDAHALEKVVFCGLSLGGLTGQWLVRNAPQRFHSLVLCNTATKIGTAESWNARIAQVGAEGLSSLLEATGQRWFTQPFRESHPEQVGAILNRFAEMPAQGYAANCAAVRDADFRNDPVTSGEIPFFVVSGRYDEVTTVDHGQDLADCLAGARHEILDVAHLSNVRPPRPSAPFWFRLSFSSDGHHGGVADHSAQLRSFYRMSWALCRRRDPSILPRRSICAMKKLVTLLCTLAMLATVAPAQAEKWEVDPAHSSLSFSVEHLGLTSINGTFNDFSGVNYETTLGGVANG